MQLTITTRVITKLTVTRLALSLVALAFQAAAGPALAAPRTLFGWLGLSEEKAVGVWETSVAREPVSIAVAAPPSPPPAPDLLKTAFTTGSIGGAQTKAAETKAAEQGEPLTGTPHAMKGLASFYHEDQITANGERFDKRALTAAHKTLPFGTRVRVTHAGTGQQVIVRINDRGPYKDGRIIDLSEAAAKEIGMESAGIAPVKLDVVGNESSRSERRGF